MQAFTIFARHPRSLAISAAALLGAWLAFYLYGWAVIDPTHARWLLTEGDPFQHFMGWDAFRRDEWRWPLGAVPRLGSLVDASIVFTDSMPLFALPLKLFHAWLPDPFQYQGLTMLVNLTLNAAVACSLALRLGCRPLNAVLFTALVLMLPIVTLRGLGAHGHEALTAHWLILWALGLALSRRNADIRTLGRWLGLLLLAVMVHFYLFFMVGTLWFAWWACHMLRHALQHDARGLLRLGMGAGVSVLVVLAAMWAVGYFQYGLEVGRETGFGYFSAELLTYLNPLSQAWFFNGTGLEGASRVLPGWLPAIAGQYEGQAYAGLGALLFLLAAFLVAVRRFQCTELGAIRWENWAVALALLGLFVFALADRWVVGKLVWDMPYPEWLQLLTQYLRSSGRLVWPLLYGLMLLGLAYLSRMVNWKPLLGLLLVAVLVQWADLKHVHSFIRDGLAQRVASVASGPPFAAIDDARLAALLDTHDRIAYLPGDDLGKLKPYAWLAARYDVALNVAYFARVNPQLLVKTTAPAVERIERGALDYDTLYVLTDAALAHRVCAAIKVTCFALDEVTIASRASNAH